MKLLTLGDLHIRATNPENRIDNYKESLFEKLRNVLKVEPSCPVLLPGDIFDSPVQSNAVLAECITLFSDRTIHGIAGQHDMKFRNMGNTALDVMIAAQVVQSSKQTSLSESVFLYSCSYGEEIPEIETKGFNILMIHKMIVDEKLWEGQEDHEWANTILRRTKFDLIVSGDNHKSFFSEYKGRHLINCGSLMRTNRNQINHEPCYVIYDTDKRVFTEFKIPIKCAEAVFDLEKIEIEKERDEKLIAFVNGLTTGEELGLNFKDTLKAVLIKNKVGKDVVEIINDAIMEG